MHELRNVVAFHETPVLVGHFLRQFKRFASLSVPVDMCYERPGIVAVIAAAWADSANKDALAAEKPDFLAEKVSDAQAWIARGLTA